MRQPELIEELGIKPKRGILLHGPPDCGKTRLAHAIGNEAEVPFYPISATDFVTGVTEAIPICSIQSPCASHSIDGGGHFRPIPFRPGLAEVPYRIGGLLHEVVRIGTLAVGTRPFGRPSLRNVYSTFRPAP
ncbi:cell division control protein 48 C-like [Trifolium medium]|uniref:Cell division control protein 48 C-like n=1 Tax=Trifolium medium TaxID=97028 RepID=A0A392NE86_9FABA|nr:cell division control protein 48 C-like [Trifolium medium]